MTVAPLESKKIQLASKMENIAEVENLINIIFEDHDLSVDYYGNMLVALTEAVNNAIVHGNKGDESKLIDLEFKHKGDEYFFTIRDGGKGFDFEHVPDPTSPENIEKPDGRGIFLMQHLADRVSFSDEGREVELVFKAY
ncbi:MAG: ATP-binding protein [Vicingaceae bacterium]